MKPVDFDELATAMEKLKRVQSHYTEASYGALLQTVLLPEERYKDRFLISNESKLSTVEVPDVRYFSAATKSPSW